MLEEEVSVVCLGTDSSCLKSVVTLDTELDLDLDSDTALDFVPDVPDPALDSALESIFIHFK